MQLGSLSQGFAVGRLEVFAQGLAEGLKAWWLNLAKPELEVAESPRADVKHGLEALARFDSTTYRACSQSLCRAPGCPQPCRVRR